MTILPQVNTSKTEAIYLYSSICGESIVEGEKKPLLHRLPVTITGNWSTNIEAPFYVPVKYNNIEVLLTISTSTKATFQTPSSNSGAFKCVLKLYVLFWGK
jgi:hypothetical protein